MIRFSALSQSRRWQRIARFVVLIVISAGFLSQVPIKPVQSAFTEIRGVWITNNDTVHFMDQGRTEAAVNTLADLNFNTLYPVVWNSGYVLYESAIAKREGIQPFSPRGDQDQDVLADIITKAHRRNLLVMPWFEFGFMAPPTSELVKRHPTWLTQRQDGSKTSISGAGEVVWFNPFRPEVQRFMTELVMEVVNQYDIDGVQFDDHTALPNEFGYDPYTIALYRRETNKPPPKDPQDSNWIRWRADKITAFMAQLNKTIKAAKPDVWISLSPATYRLAYKTYLQNWLDWIRKDIVDEVVVQVYRTNLPSFTEPIQRPEFLEAKKHIPTAVGILTGLPTKQVAMPLVQQKVRAARSQGLGTAFFYFKTLWDVAPEDKTARMQAFQSLFPSPAFRQKLPVTAPAAPSSPNSGSPTPTTPPPPAPPLVGTPIPILMPGETSPAPTSPSSSNAAPSPDSGGFPVEPTLDPAIPGDWYE